MTPLGWLGRKTSTQTNIETLLLSTNFLFDGIYPVLMLSLLKTGFDNSRNCQLSPKETICMKCQSLFPGKKKNISISADDILKYFYFPQKIGFETFMQIKPHFWEDFVDEAANTFS